MLDYRYLYCCRVVAKKMASPERLDIAIQSISPKVRELNKAVGHRLRKHCDDVEEEIHATRSRHRPALWPQPPYDQPRSGFTGVTAVRTKI